MSTDASWKIQVSPKTPSGTLINVRGDSGEEVKVGLEQVGAIAGTIATTEALLTGAGAAAAGGLVTPAPVADEAQAQQFAPPQTNAPVANNGGQVAPPTCPHGPRTFKSGVGAKGPWAAYFCAAAKGTPGACDPQWVKA
jgi:hypothetical protein